MVVNDDKRESLRRAAQEICDRYRAGIQVDLLVLESGQSWVILKTPKPAWNAVTLRNATREIEALEGVERVTAETA